MAPYRTSDRRSDEDLIRACNEGDAREAARAFDSLYQRHKDFVLRVALRFVRDNDSALDVLQETFTYLLRKFPPAGNGLQLSSKLTTLLYPVAKNNAITLLRKTERAQNPDGPDPDELPAQETSDYADVRALLSGLADERRELVMLRFVDGMSLQDIAETLEIPLGTVKSRLHLAIKELRKLPEVKAFFDP